MKPGYISAEDLRKWLAEQREEEWIRWDEAIDAGDSEECGKCRGAHAVIDRVSEKVFEMWLESNTIAEEKA